jgi:hypothetical protein
MRYLVLSALLLASAYQIAFGVDEGSWTYTVSNNQATITRYTGADGAVEVPSSLNGISVTSIGTNAFFGCDHLTTVTIPNSVTIIGSGAFSQCTGLSTITIPTSVISIGSGAFYECVSLTSIAIPYGVTSIGISTFFGCSSLTTVTVPSSVTSIENSAFAFCSALLTFTIPNSVTSIGTRAFVGCTALTSITIPSSVTSIPSYAFYACTGLTTLTIPNSVTSIGDYAFAKCSDQLVSSVISQLASSNATNYTAGQQGVIANPNTHNLYTTSQIQNMAVGDLVLTRQVSGGFVLNYDIEQSTDLQTWTTYAPLSLPLTGLPTDKAFVRMKLKSSQPLNSITIPNNVTTIGN